MKLQNLAIIFIVIFIPLLLVLSYYLDQQRDTLALQAEYDLKLSEATKEGIKAFEINTVDWASTKQTYARNNAKATINTFITSLANNLNISGTAREYMLDYIPAVALTMYDGYYVYAPAYTSVTIKNENGVQLFLNGTEITTDSDGEIIYEPKSGVSGNTATYTYTNSAGNLETNNITYTTSKDDAKKEYKHTLNNKTAYTEEYVKGNNTYIVNYTLDNKISVYKIDNAGNTEQKTGYLVYFNEDTTNQTILPRIKINGDNTISPVNTTSIVSNIQYSKSDNETTKIQPETLTEQILYKDLEEGEPKLGTFKYVYTTTNEKLYYDGSNFFKLKNNVREYLNNSNSVGVGDDECYYKSLSLLIGEGKTTKFKKIYQVLNGKHKEKWYIDLKDNDGVLDTEIKNLTELGIDTTIYKNYSDINYYVEAYAFTNWVKQELGTGELKQKKLEYKLNSSTNKFEAKYEEATCTNIFKISADNNPEDETSIFVEHKKEVMKDSINTNLNAAISSYNRNGNYDFKLPILTDGDWEQIFSNISLITFFQGVPIGLKYYNNYAIATSTTNREYVDPNEIFFTGTNDEKYHQVYCDNCLNEGYTGYRSTEYTLREYTYKEKAEDGTETTETKYYYQHDNNINSSAEIGCYYCIINKANYTQTSDEEITNLQTKSYNEALARERYYQNEKVTAKVGINLIYNSNVEVDEHEGGFIKSVIDVNPKEVLIEYPNEPFLITEKIPVIETNNDIEYEFLGWSLSPDATSPDYLKNAYIYNPTQVVETLGTKEITLYAVWKLKLEKLNWYKYCYHPTEYTTSYTHDNISNIKIDNNNVYMIGNNTNPGKGAVLLNWEYLNVDIMEISFDYTIAFGDSFNTAGLLLNVNDTNPGGEEGILKGYMISFNNTRNVPWSTRRNNGENATVWMFENYGKNEYNVNLKEKTEASPTNNLTWKAGLNIPLQGRIIITVTNSGYKIKEEKTGEEVEIVIEEGMNVSKNSIGFFSDHYSHSCPQIGHFNITNINLIAKQK